MQISNKTLLNSAEGIIKERKEEGRGRPGQDAGADKQTPRQTQGITQGLLESRLLNIQAGLATVQSQYSREQARWTYLEKHRDQINSSLKFEDKPMFPELADGIKPDELQLSIKENMATLTRTLKGLQIEMENLYALNPDARQTAGRPATTAILDSGVLRDLDPARVARLTRES